MDVYDEMPVPLPADLAERIETEHTTATIAVKLLLATIAVVLFESNHDAHTANQVYTALTLDEERRAQFADDAGAVALRLENNGDRAERERAAAARPGLDFFRFEWPLYAHSRRRDQIVGRATTLLTTVAPGWITPQWMLWEEQPRRHDMSLPSLRAWLDNPSGGPRRFASTPCAVDSAFDIAPEQRAAVTAVSERRSWFAAAVFGAGKLKRAIRDAFAPESALRDEP